MPATTSPSSQGGQAAAGRRLDADGAPTAAGGFVMGNPNAKAKLIEYGSMTCPHCREFDEKGVPTADRQIRQGGQVS